MKRLLRIKPSSNPKISLLNEIISPPLFLLKISPFLIDLKCANDYVVLLSFAFSHVTEQTITEETDISSSRIIINH